MGRTRLAVRRELPNGHPAIGSRVVEAGLVQGDTGVAVASSSDQHRAVRQGDRHVIRNRGVRAAVAGKAAVLRRADTGADDAAGFVLSFHEEIAAAEMVRAGEAGESGADDDGVMGFQNGGGKNF